MSTNESISQQQLQNQEQSFTIGANVYWINPKPDEPTRAKANFHIGGYVAKGLKIINGDKGEFVSMPSYKTNDDGYKDVFRPTTAEAREQMNNLVMQAYKQKLAEQAQGETYLVVQEVPKDNTEPSDSSQTCVQTM